MKKLCTALALMATVSLASCAAGPHQLRRSVDDWDHEMYIENPWMNGILWFVPVIPIAHMVGGIGDFLITDAYAFWFKDAWDGKGTAFTHYNPAATDGSMESLMIDDAKFLAIN